MKVSDYEQIRRMSHPDQHWGCVTFAQHGDDLMIVNLFKLLGVELPSYLDLGAHHPFNISNTALLYERGSRGVNIEANPNLIPPFKLYRPEDKTVNIGVAVLRGGVPFYMYSETSGLNSFSKDHVEKFKHLEVRKTEVLDCITVNEIVAKYCNGVWPDLLTLDLEGLDLEILKSADFSKSKPRVICVEVRRGESAAFKSLLAERGYFCYCRMGENLFFVREDDSYLVY
jgi:FkbM family methyltransferase